MMDELQTEPRFTVRPYRRLVQVLVLAGLVLLPLASQNPNDWAPSRIVQGQIPVPATIAMTGDTWSFQINGFSLVHPLAFLDNWFSAHIIYVPILAAALLPIALTLLFGRIFCSWLCPVGFLLELNTRVRRGFTRLGIAKNFTVQDFRYIILAICLIFAFFLSVPVISVVDPPHILGRELMNLFTHHTVSLAGIAILAGILIVDTFLVPRGCCSKLCPSGGGLSLLGKYRILRIHLSRKKCIECGNCDTSCPYDLSPMALGAGSNFDWTKCDNCGLCRDSCPTGAIKYRYGKSEK